MFSKLFWTDTLERALKTFAQSIVSAPIAAAITAAVSTGAGAELKFILINAAIAAVVSVLTSIGSRNFGDKDTPSLVETPAEVKLESLATIPPPAKLNDPESVATAIPPSLSGGD